MKKEVTIKFDSDDGMTEVIVIYKDYIARGGFSDCFVEELNHELNGATLKMLVEALKEEADKNEVRKT